MFPMTRMKRLAVVTAKRIYRLDQGDLSELDPPAIPWLSRGLLGALGYLRQCLVDSLPGRDWDLGQG